MKMNIENVMVMLASAIEKCYAENKNLDFGVFEDLHYDLCIQWKLEQKIEDDGGYKFQDEADAAFYSRFGHLGSI